MRLSDLILVNNIVLSCFIIYFAFYYRHDFVLGYFIVEY